MTTYTGWKAALTAALGQIKSALDGKAAAGHTHSELHTHANAAALDLVSGTNTGDEPNASVTVAGIVELATTAEATGGTDTTRAVTPAGLKAVADTKATLTHTHPHTSIAGFTEATQDVVGAMIVGAGGTYDDDAGTITLPDGGTVTMTDAEIAAALEG